VDEKQIESSDARTQIIQIICCRQYSAFDNRHTRPIPYRPRPFLLKKKLSWMLDSNSVRPSVVTSVRNAVMHDVIVYVVMTSLLPLLLLRRHRNIAQTVPKAREWQRERAPKAREQTVPKARSLQGSICGELKAAVRHNTVKGKVKSFPILVTKRWARS